MPQETRTRKRGELSVLFLFAADGEDAGDNDDVVAAETRMHTLSIDHAVVDRSPLPPPTLDAKNANARGEAMCTFPLNRTAIVFMLGARPALPHYCLLVNPPHTCAARMEGETRNGVAVSPPIQIWWQSPCCTIDLYIFVYYYDITKSVLQS